MQVKSCRFVVGRCTTGISFRRNGKLRWQEVTVYQKKKSTTENNQDCNVFKPKQLQETITEEMKENLRAITDTSCSQGDFKDTVTNFGIV
ncbi:hypothetical protein AVEN_33473-1 [Araneus ventricosus]|uniref:Uncharacterized protein n=1 Tax=Araneus ventricosus TaxID=182803 RepID=A0A4Y1ZNU5_ARAVE|nr:hypothetical protein AVEN_33473-1 [Araneus ventricosus]